MGNTGLHWGDRGFSSSEVWAFVAGVIVGQIIYGVAAVLSLSVVLLTGSTASRSAAGAVAVIAAAVMGPVICFGIGSTLGRLRSVTWAFIAGAGAACVLAALRVMFQDFGDGGITLAIFVFVLALGAALTGGYAYAVRRWSTSPEQAPPPRSAV